MPHPRRSRSWASGSSPNSAAARVSSSRSRRKASCRACITVMSTVRGLIRGSPRSAAEALFAGARSARAEQGRGSSARHRNSSCGACLQSVLVDVELRHLRAFEVLAQELNFTRAAVRLHLSQQALSAQIRELERRCGAELFHRTTRSVELTDAGRTLVRHVPGILLSVGQAVAETRRTAAANSRPHLMVGLRGTSGVELVSRVL